jgi:hypothetical protein
MKKHTDTPRGSPDASPRSKYPSWVVEDALGVLPGPVGRQEYRWRVIDLAGAHWLTCPVSVRETILSRHIETGDYHAAVREILAFRGVEEEEEHERDRED